MSKNRSISYLFRFMLIFEINRFHVLSETEQTITAKVGWPDDGTPDYDEDEETQYIEWDIQHFDNIEDAIWLSEYLCEHELIYSDKILISTEDLCKHISWNSKKVQEAIDTLLQIKVDMIDDGKKSDFFFLHF